MGVGPYVAVIVPTSWVATAPGKRDSVAGIGLNPRNVYVAAP